jgi:galactokinase/mevalonate kinase-like predicted kinase
VIKEGLEKGALAAKLCGGGGGGYVLFVVDPKEKNKIIMEIIRSGKIVRDISLIPHGFSVVET